MSPLPASLDHLVYATPDLSRTVRELERHLGVAATPGGRHPSWGTHNSLLSLGRRMYFEIIGPDPEANRPAGKRPFGIDGLRGPSLSTWVARAQRLEGAVKTARSLGVELGEPQPRSRQKPDGSVLSWTMTDPLQYREGGVVPFFIDWGDSPHPSEDAAQGCVLEELRIEHPDADRVRSVLRGLGLNLPVTLGERPCLTATLSGPRGKLEIR